MNEATNGNGKADKFRELAEKRVPRAMRSIRQIGRLSRRSSYEWTPEHVDKIFNTLRAELDEAQAKFAPREKQQLMFTL